MTERLTHLSDIDPDDYIFNRIFPNSDVTNLCQYYFLRVFYAVFRVLQCMFLISYEVAVRTFHFVLIKVHSDCILYNFYDKHL